MTKEMERRTFGFELRDNAGKPEITGYAAVFNSMSVDMWGFREQVAPGAFKKTLQEQDVCALWNHDTGAVMGRMSQNMTLVEDERGLAIDLTDPVMSAEQREMMQRGLVDKMSFGFETIRDLWEEDRAAETVTRTLLEVRLFEVSVVTFPAYTDTSASMRAVDKAKEIRSKFAAPGDHAAAVPQDITGPVLHLADERRMRVEIARRKLQLTN